VPGVLVIHGSSGLAAHYKSDMISFAEALSNNARCIRSGGMLFKLLAWRGAFT
jgi:hypothetical protein